MTAETTRFPSVRVTGRLAELRARRDDLADRWWWITGREDVRWLTGFSGSAGSLLVAPDRARLLVDGRYGERAAVELVAAGAEGIEVEVLDHEQLDAVVRSAPGPLVVQSEAVTLATAAHVEADGGPRLQPVDGLVGPGREVKDDAELARVRRAAEVADRALAVVVTELLVRGGVTERDVARALDRSMEDLGADGPGYPTIVASGPNAALPHHHAGDRPLEVGDLVIIDVGAEVDGYRSDMTRTFVVGGEPADPDAVLWLEVVRRAQRAGVAACTRGTSGRDVDRAAREVLAADDLADAFVHGVGHGVGLVIHEPPFLSRSDAPLRPGQVVTVEPGVYVPGRGGVRWEDTVLVTDVAPEVLTSAPKEPDPRRW